MIKDKRVRSYLQDIRHNVDVVGTMCNKLKCAYVQKIEKVRVYLKIGINSYEEYR